MIAPFENTLFLIPLSQTGRCKDWKRGRCGDRHRASPLDLDDKVLTGVVTFTVLRVETPVVYWVKMTRQQDERRFGSDDGLHLAMARFFSSPQARKVVKVVEKGLLVAAEGRDGLIRRARVQVLVYKQVVGGGRQLEKLEVFTVDEGLLEVVNPGEVYELPERLVLCTSHNLELFAAFLLPPSLPRPCA